MRRAAGNADESLGTGIGAEIEAVRGLYDDILRERYDRPEARLSDLEQLRVIAGGYPNRAAFLSAIALEPPQSTQDLAAGGDAEDDALILSTAHSAKGKWSHYYYFHINSAAIIAALPYYRFVSDEQFVFSDIFSLGT